MNLRPEELWLVTCGELCDMAEGARYREWLDTCRMARHAAWVMNGAGMLKRPVSMEDLAGTWFEGRVVSKWEAYEITKRRIKERRREV